MKAEFSKITAYTVLVTCVSPLRTGDSAGDTEQILKRPDKRAFLQGASIAGVFRNYRANDILLGNSEREGMLSVSDLVFDPSADVIKRPRVRIDAKTGTAVQGSKHDIAALAAGSTGTFSLVLRTGIDSECFEQQTEQYLAAMHAGEITLGAQKSNGFGKVELRVFKRVFDMTVPAEREAWLADEAPDCELELCTIAPVNVTFTITAELDNILVKDITGSGFGSEGVDAQNLCEGNNYVIPGSAIKGVLRKACGYAAAGNPGFASPVELFGTADGDKKTAGCVAVSDALMPESSKSIKKSTINRIHIDRFTGGVYFKGFFKEETLTGKTSWTVRLPDDSGRKCLPILFALRDLALGVHNLGSGNAVGHGHIRSMRVDISAPSGTAAMECSGESIEIKDTNGLLRSWAEQTAEGK